MKGAWKIILTIALVVLVIGVVAILAGMLTGASTERMIEVVFGGREAMDAALTIIKQELASLF